MTVFAVLTHGRHNTVNLLTELLDPFPVVVHVDSKSSSDGIRAGRNVTLCDRRYDVRWGGFSVVKATLELYRRALELAADDDHIVLLSGQCLPLKPVEDIDNYLRSKPLVQHCAVGALLDGEPANESRLTSHWAFDRYPARQAGLRQSVNAFRRKLAERGTAPIDLDAFAEFRMVAGSQWTALSTPCLRDLLLDDERVERLAQLLKYSLAPDEIFFHTLLYSSSWAEFGTGDPRVGKGTKSTSEYANLHYIDPSLTRVLTSGDMRILAKGPYFFARKFDAATEPDLAEFARGLIGARGNA